MNIIACARRGTLTSLTILAIASGAGLQPAVAASAGAPTPSAYFLDALATRHGDAGFADALGALSFARNHYGAALFERRIAQVTGNDGAVAPVATESAPHAYTPAAYALRTYDLDFRRLAVHERRNEDWRDDDFRDAMRCHSHHDCRADDDGVKTVPLPASFGLLSLACAGVLALRRRTPAGAASRSSR